MLTLEIITPDDKVLNTTAEQVLLPTESGETGILPGHVPMVTKIVAGELQLISKGQTEAAGALGLRPGRIMNLVILPQALRVIIPPLISQYLNLTKNSSLAIAVGYMDITGTLGGITMNQTGRELECVLRLMLVYLTISLLISAVMNWYNNKVKLVER